MGQEASIIQEALCGCLRLSLRSQAGERGLLAWREEGHRGVSLPFSRGGYGAIWGTPEGRAL